MSRTALREFQKTAVNGGVELFSECKRLLDVAGKTDVAGRATVLAQMGTLLLEAPTGSGKTLIAGHLVEEFSKVDDVVWFWFAPFKGVTGQTSSTLRAEFPGLRVRELSEDRHANDSRSGDVFVTTWQTVATKVKDSRNVHKPGEKNLTLEELLEAMRNQNLRVGVVVDEAHHGFFGSGVETQAMKFFRESLQPEYTVFITATPDDADIERFQKTLNIGNLNRTTIGRHEPVEDGLIKEGVKCVAFFAQPGQENLVDYEDVALREGAAAHREIKAAIKKLGVELVPLMLVQVDSTAKSVERAKEKLLKLNFTEEQIAIHTADEPDSNLLALANDERREVLVFKMAVALGFDAPRASTLVSMRAARDEDFGVQLVGRILRVHRRLQGRARAKTLPEILRYGFVLLADAETQTGLDLAGQRINKLQTEFTKVTPTLSIVFCGGQPYVQKPGPGGQFQLIPLPPPPTPAARTPTPAGSDLFSPKPPVSDGNFSYIGSFFDPPPRVAAGVAEEKFPDTAPAIILPRRYSYRLKPEVPRRFKTQLVSGDNEVTEEECANHFVVSSQEMLRALAAKVQVQKKTLEIFTHQIQLEFTNAAMEPDEASRAALNILHKSGTFDTRELKRALLRKLKATLKEMGLDQAEDAGEVQHLLNVILCSNPQLLFDAQKAALATHCEVLDTDAELPATIESDAPLATSRLNVYGVFPSDLNTWEREFADLLDRDQGQVVSWWHRNLPHKDWSVQVMLPDGAGFYPDFVIGVDARKRWDGTLLADPKFYFELSAELPKVQCTHPTYGKVLILSKQISQWMVVHYDAKQLHAVADQEFRLADAASY